MKILLSFVLIFSSLSASANVLDCSSADGKFAYHVDTPNGGPQRGPGITLTVDGNLLIQVFPLPRPGIPNVVNATVELADHYDWQQTQNESSQTITTYVTQVSVTSPLNSNHVVYSGKVFCKESVYVGPPIP